MASRIRIRDSFSTRSARASLIFQGLQVQTLKPASVGLAPVASAGSGGDIRKAVDLAAGPADLDGVSFVIAGKAEG
jgi:hypothetical protein